MLTSAPNLTLQARAFYARGAAVRLLAVGSVTVLHRRQSRTLRLGLGRCSSHVDPERRRHRTSRCKGAEHPNRDLSWGQQSDSENAKRAGTRVANHYWDTRDARRSTRYSSSAGVQSPDNATGVRPGRNIEDVERGAIDHFFFGKGGKDSWRPYDYDHWSAPLHNIRSFIAHRQEQIRDAVFGAVTEVSTNEAPKPARVEAERTSTTEEDYVIDPITNRRVPKRSRKLSPEGEVEIPIRTFKKYRSQFTPLPPPEATKAPARTFGDGSHPPPELRRYWQFDGASSQVQNGVNPATTSAPDPDLPPSPEELLSYSRPEIDSIQPGADGVLPSGGYFGVNPPPPEATKFGQVTMDHSLSRTTRAQDGALPSLAPALASRSDQTPVIESDRYIQDLQPLDSAASATGGKGNTTWHYDGITPHDDAPTALSDRPGFVAWEEAEPTIRYEMTPANTVAPMYEDLGKYEPVMEPELEAPQYPPPKYEDTHRYKAVRYNEPDGRPPGYVENETPEDLHLYKPFMYNEPDGKPLAHEEQSHDPTEVQKYKAFRWNEPDGRPTGTERREPEAVELDRYKPVKYNEPDGKPSEVDSTAVEPSELEGYQPVWYNEPHGRPQVVKLTEKPKDDSAATAEDSKTFDYSAGRSSVSDPSLVAESAGDHAAILKRLDQLSSTIADYETEAATSSKALETPDKKSRSRPIPDILMAHFRAASDAADQEALAAVKSAKSRAQPQQGESTKSGYTGNYVRDFPEDFAQTWTSVPQAGSSILKPREGVETSYNEGGQAGAQADEKDIPDSVSADDDYFKLEPSLDRQYKKSEVPEDEGQQALADLYSAEPQGLETSYAEECIGRSTWPAFAKVQKSLDLGDEAAMESPGEPKAAARDQSPGVSEPEGSEETVYKILAYDPTMRTVNIAETSSTVPDTSAPLTPAEVIVRLSNPSEFFHHFAPLQAQGFEIVSGSGDVLVFRRVRNPKATGEPIIPGVSSAAVTRPVEPPLATASVAKSPAAALVNPIDMTGTRLISPAAGSFMSPTGYVNYDPPPFEDKPSPLPLPPRFRSNIDVRREEPVFSGPKAEKQGAHQAKNVGKRVLVGAAWLAGVSYALGVIGEYFRTGGIDGVGPKGF